jgi:Dolichyl-phosphate-mannose-protein mannosyltransferase
MQGRRSWSWWARAVGLVVAIGALAALRLCDIRTYPILAPDEGIWNSEARDSVLFHDHTMSEFPGMFLSPLHYALSWLLLQAMPATCFSIRLMMGVVGMGSLAVIWYLLARRYATHTAASAVLIVGLSFVMIAMNRRAYLESSVMLLSLVTVGAAACETRARHLLMAVCVASIVLYKVNALYLVPALLIPASIDPRRREIALRLGAVTGGVLAGLLVLLAISRSSPETAASALHFELSKGADSSALVQVGRFRIAPALILKTLQSLALQYTDLMFLTAVGLIAFFASRAWEDRFVLRLAVWLVSGYVFLFTQWSHVQYFAPLIVPAGMLSACALSRFQDRWSAETWARAPLAVVTTCVAVFGVARVGVGWRLSHERNVQMSAVRWLETQDLGDSALLAGPEIVVATERRGYAFSRVFHPLPPRKAPRLAEFIARHDVRLILFDEWETAPYFADEPEFSAELARFPRVAAGPGWTAYEVPRGSPHDGSTRASAAGVDLSR